MEFSVRISETLSICFAVIGRCSEIWMPFAAVGIALNGPPVSVPGFGSQVSIWLCAPCIQKRMQAFAFAPVGRSCSSAEASAEEGSSAKGSPNFEAMPAAAELPRAIRTKSRREQFLQCAMVHPMKTNSEELNSIQKMST